MYFFRFLRAAAVLSMEPELAALHASLQQCVPNWPNSMLQDVALDVDNKSALKGDIEEDVARFLDEDVELWCIFALFV